MGDNKVFNVNGRSKEQLKLAIQLALQNEYGDSKKVNGWRFSKNHGLILLWHVEEKGSKAGNRFPVPLTFEKVTDIVWDWLQTDEAKTVPFESWDSNADHDGSNELGWRVYCEDWGHVDEDWGAIVAIKPAYIWYGK